jgi:hypothetical protein
MDYGSLLTPAVVSAVVSVVISGGVAISGFLISARTARTIHGERLTFDREQAERRVDAEITLYKKKVPDPRPMTRARTSMTADRRHACTRACFAPGSMSRGSDADAARESAAVTPRSSRSIRQTPARSAAQGGSYGQGLPEAFPRES